MGRFLKIIIIIVLCILAFIGLMVTCTGFMIKKGVETVAHKIMDAGPEMVTLTPKGAIISKALSAQRILTFTGVEFCRRDGSPLPNYSSSSACVNGQCTATITLNKGQPLSRDMIIYRKYNGQCVEQTIPNVVNYQTIRYTGSIAIKPVTAKKLQLTEIAQLTPVKTALSKFNNYSSTTLFGDTIFNLDYGAIKPAEDEFMLGTKLIKIQYLN